MNKIFSITFLLLWSIFLFVKGYNAVFKSEKQLEKNLSQRTKLQRKYDNFFSYSKDEAIFWMRVTGIAGLVFATLLIIIIFLIIFGVLTPAK